MKKKQTINFEDTATAFAHKSKKELKKAYWLFYSMKFPSLIRFGTSFINFALKIHLPIQGILKSTLFSHFCGGESIEECNSTIKELGSHKIGTILDYSVEGEKTENAFIDTKNEIIRTIDKASQNETIPFSVFKVTGVFSIDLLLKIQEREELSSLESKQIDDAKNRINEICNTAFEKDVCLFIDAEETWIQDAIDSIVCEMMEKYNKEKAIVYNTIQFYRADGLELLHTQHQHSLENNYFYGIKVVRGAYMEQERERAEEMNYESPIHISKEGTDNCYDNGLAYCINNLNNISLCAGTHNEKSSNLLVSLLADKSINKTDPKVFFAQLYGMSNHISFNLSKEGYNVAKYVPYGPVKSVLPYLFRRAEENTSIAGQTGRELALIKKELRRRKG